MGGVGDNEAARLAKDKLNFNSEQIILYNTLSMPIPWPGTTSATMKIQINMINLMNIDILSE